MIRDQLKDVARFFYSFVPIQLRLGNHYAELRSFLKSAQWWELEKIASWQFVKLKAMVSYAYQYVPGYYELYKSAGITPTDIESLEDIRYLPFTTKELLRDNLKDFTSTKISRWKLRYVTTGGSTGIPFGFYHTATSRWVENAFIHTGWERSGWKPGKLSAVFRGAYIGTEEEYYSINRLWRELNFSTYFLSERTYPKYFNHLVSAKPFSIQAYPSAITMLSDLMIERGDAGKVDVKVILLGSENLYGWQKEKIKTAFPRAHLFAWYGHAEQVVLAPWCETLDEYHAWPFYGIVELLNEKNENVDVGSNGEIVGSSFWNFGTPFIRYRTMDLAENGGIGCVSCKRNFPIFKKIEGRLQEVIVTATGRYISMTAINVHSDTFDDVRQFQFLQEKPGKVTLKIVPKSSFSKESFQKILCDIKPKFGSDVDLELALVTEIARTKSGKTRFLEQRLDIRYGDKD